MADRGDPRGAVDVHADVAPRRRGAPHLCECRRALGSSQRGSSGSRRPQRRPRDPTGTHRRTRRPACRPPSRRVGSTSALITAWCSASACAYHAGAELLEELRRVGDVREHEGHRARGELSRAPSSAPGRGRGILAEDPPLQLAQLGASARSRALHESTSRVLIGGEGFRLASGAVERASSAVREAARGRDAR